MPNSLIPYTKPAISYYEQVLKLKSRGMIIDNQVEAEFYLQHIGYYRLGAYWLPFESNHATHQFQPDTYFNDVLHLYRFDRELRLLIMDAIERIEVSVRAQWAYQLGHTHGAHAHLNSNLFNPKTYQSNIDSLKKEVERSEEVFIKHLINTYSEPLPPVWASCEVMSLGLLSKWFTGLKPMSLRSKIAIVYDLDESVLQSWLHHLSIVRNICAHHSRLWNRQFGRVAPKEPHTKPKSLQRIFVKDDGLYNTLLILLHMMDVISSPHQWRTRLRTLLEKHDDLLLKYMSFPADWQTKNIWN